MQMKYISSLLYDNDCVIIPGLGGFVSNYEPARIEGDRNRFMPPSKKILFNSRLTSNDGLLANHIANIENISYNKAMDIIRRFVGKCIKELDDKGKVRFSGVGILYKDANDKLLFEQDPQNNYLPEAYGLSQFISPAIYRESSYQRFENKMKESPVISLRRRKIMKSLKWAAILIPVAAIATWSYLNLDKIENTYEKYAIYFKPLHEQVDKKTPALEDRYEAAKDFASKNAENAVNTSSILPSNASDDNSGAPGDKLRDAAPVEEKSPEAAESGTTENPVPEQKAGQEMKHNSTQPAQPSHQYHIITGSFISRTNAQQHLSQLKSFGFPARMAGQSSSGYYRVSALSTRSKKAAIAKLQTIREEDFSKAWVLKK